MLEPFLQASERVNLHSLATMLEYLVGWCIGSLTTLILEVSNGPMASNGLTLIL